MNRYIRMEPGQYYHVYNRGNAFENLFYNQENYLFFLQKCQKYINEVATFYAFALLPNHFHLLIKIHSRNVIGIDDDEQCAKRVSQVFSNLFNSYTKSFNRYYHRRGTLFSQHFKRSHLDTLSYRLNTVLYLHHNAIHHQYCMNVEEWPYTSYRKFISEPDDIISQEVLSWFGGLEEYLKACALYKVPLEGERYLE